MMPVPELRPWLFDVVLPFWADIGVDRVHGGFVERLALDRTPAPDDYKRVRVQARQIYAFSHAHLLGAPDWALDAAWHGYAFLTEKCWAATGGWLHLVTSDGTPLDSRNDTYDQAFVLFALAWLHRATGDTEPLDWVTRTVEFLDHRLADPRAGGFHEEVPAEHPADQPVAPTLPRRQNPHMHMLEAMLALHEATGDDAWLDRARRLVDLFRRRFVDAETGTLGEYFTADWRPANGGQGHCREPGHHFEWVWLLFQYRRATGDDAVLRPADALYRFALDHGIDRAPGMVTAAFDETDQRGAVLRDSKRLWPQTEALKAFVARHEFSQDPRAATYADAILRTLFDHYVGADHPVWRDQLSRDGRETSDAIPASTLYHLFLCMAEAMRVLNR